jgi:ABC-type sulfate/molybdate transport systems ATPase subunit
MAALNVDVKLARAEITVNARLTVQGEGLTALVGPSGSGKSSLLRIIAGLENPSAGRIVYGNEVWFDAQKRLNVSPQRRHTGLLFQDYALFSHMSVTANIGYGLPRPVRAKIVSSWLERLGLKPFAERRPQQLSGGQRQRVALARTLAAKPKVLLLDEPFSAVDATRRGQLREQLAMVVADLKRPVLIVTHDLEDVRYLASHLGVLVDGRLVRFGPTAGVFADPGTLEVAEVLGWRNFLPVCGVCGIHVHGEWGEVTLDQVLPEDIRWLGIRPEYIRVSRQPKSGLSARVTDITEHGATREMRCRLKEGSVLYVRRPWNEPLPAPGSRLDLVLPPPYIVPLNDSAEDVTLRDCVRREVSPLDFNVAEVYP